MDCRETEQQPGQDRQRGHGTVQSVNMPIRNAQAENPMDMPRTIRTKAAVSITFERPSAPSGMPSAQNAEVKYRAQTEKHRAADIKRQVPGRAVHHPNSQKQAEKIQPGQQTHEGNHAAYGELHCLAPQIMGCLWQTSIKSGFLRALK